MASKKHMYIKQIPFPLAVPLNFVISEEAEVRGNCFDKTIFDLVLVL